MKMIIFYLEVAYDLGSFERFVLLMVYIRKTYFALQNSFATLYC